MARPRAQKPMPTPDLHVFAFEDEVEFAFARRPTSIVRAYYFEDSLGIPTLCRRAKGREQVNRYHRVCDVLLLRVWRRGELVAAVHTHRRAS